MMEIIQTTLLIFIPLTLWFLINKLIKKQNFEQMHSEFDNLEKQEEAIIFNEAQLENSLEKDQKQQEQKLKENHNLQQNSQIKNEIMHQQQDETKIINNLVDITKKEEKIEKTINELVLEEKKKIVSENEARQNTSKINLKEEKVKAENLKKISETLHTQAEFTAKNIDIEKANEIDLLSKEKDLESKKREALFKLEEIRSLELNKLNENEVIKKHFDNIELLNSQINVVISEMKKTQEQIMEIESKIKDAEKRWNIWLKFDAVERALDKEEEDAAQYPWALQKLMNAYNSRNIQELKKILASEGRRIDLIDIQILEGCKKLIDERMSAANQRLTRMKTEQGYSESRSERRQKKWKELGIGNPESRTLRDQHNMKLYVQLENQLFDIQHLRNYTSEKDRLEKQRNKIMNENKKLIENYNLEILKINKKYSEKRKEIEENFEHELKKLKTTEYSLIDQAA